MLELDGIGAWQLGVKPTETAGVWDEDIVSQRSMTRSRSRGVSGLVDTRKRHPGVNGC